MTHEEFTQNPCSRPRKWEWPIVGDKVKFKNADGFFYPHYTDVIAFAKENLTQGQIYTVRRCEVYSSWCALWLEEIEGDHCFHRAMFEWPLKEENNESND